MRAKNASPKSKLHWIADAEKEKQKYQNLRAPDSRAFLSQELSTIGSNWMQSNAIENKTSIGIECEK